MMLTQFRNVLLLAGFVLATGAHAQEPIRINVQAKQGAVKPVNGICNGPVTFGGVIDSSAYFRQAAFPFCRVHDMNWPNPREVDIHTIFKDFSADADDPANYDFRATDAYINSIEAVGAKIIYRLGESIEHTKVKYHVHPPADFGKWAKICLNIARHYNEGWAGGYRKNILYWEVWNEPDQLIPDRRQDPMWSGTPEQYRELYAVTARLFKKEMPYAKIGGYGTCASGPITGGQKGFFLDFLKYARDNAVPLDFFSWHYYGTSVQEIRNVTRVVREQLDAHGFTQTESVLDEWNYVERWSFDTAEGRRKMFSEMSGIPGTTFTAAALIEMTNLPVDIATFYDGQPGNIFGTIFDRFGFPTKQFHAFDAFNWTISGGQRVLAENPVPDVYALAVVSDAELRVMLVNDTGKKINSRIEITGLDPAARYRYTVHVLDERRDFEKISGRELDHADLPGHINLPANSMVLLTLSAM